MPYITDNEVGRVEAALARLQTTTADQQHRARNDRQLIVLLQAELEELRLDLERTKTRIYTALSVFMFVGTVLAWAFENLGTGK